MSKKILKHLRRIERLAYPEFMWGMQDVFNKRDLYDYCESRNVKVLIETDAYAILSDNEIVDVASVSVISGVKIMRKLLRELSGVFSFDARHNTSYKIVKAFESSQRITILQDDMWYWEGELMHNMKIEVL